MKPQTAQHTPTPWRLDNDGKFIRGRDGDDIGAPHGLNAAQVRANTAFIVRAVNCHEELLECLKEANAKLNVEGHHDHKWDQAIARAEGR